MHPSIEVICGLSGKKSTREKYYVVITRPFIHSNYTMANYSEAMAFPGMFLVIEGYVVVALCTI